MTDALSSDNIFAGLEEEEFFNPPPRPAVTKPLPKTQTQPPQPSFDPSIPKRAYTDAEWKLKEDWYIDQVNLIHISSAPMTADIQNWAAQIDYLMTIARLDYAFIHGNYERYTLQMKNEEKRLFVELKLQPPQAYANLKLTVDDMKGVVTSVINANTWLNTGLSLYTLVETCAVRNIFMESIIRALQDKKDLLITHSGMLKIENSVSMLGANGVQPNYNNG